MSPRTLAGVLALLGCGPAPDGRVQALVADYDADGIYAPVVRTMETLDEDGAALSGSAARIQGLGDVSLNVSPSSELSEVRDQMLVDPGGDVRPRWARVDGALYPRDFEAFALTTLYHHLERGASYYEGAGASLPGPLEVHYLPRVHLTAPDLSEIDLADNALYFFGVRFLVVTRFELLQTLPLGMNRGVVVHELGHAIFDELVYDDAARIRLLAGDLDDRTGNLLRSITEGLSDFFAAHETADADFIRWSVDDALLAHGRDLDEPVTYGDALLDSAESIPQLYDPYLPGTCLASALWRMEIDRAAIAAALVEAQRALGARLVEEAPWESPPEDFGFAWLLEPFVVALDEEGQSAACAVIAEQLPAAAPFVSSCP